MTVQEKLEEAKVSFEKMQRARDFHDLKIFFHSACGSLSSVHQVANKGLKEKLEGKFFPEVIKIIREDDFHPPAVDAFAIASVRIGMSGGIISKGPLRIGNQGTFIIDGVFLPQGDIVFGEKTASGIRNTVDGESNSDLDRVHVVTTIKMRDLFDTRVKPKLKKNGINDDEVRRWSERVCCYHPQEFLMDAIAYYEKMLLQ